MNFQYIFHIRQFSVLVQTYRIYQSTLSNLLPRLQIQTCRTLKPTFNPVLKMNTIYFRHQDETKQFLINFRYVNPGYGIDRVFNLMRSESERVDSCLERIRGNLEKEFVKKNRKQVYQQLTD